MPSARLYRVDQHSLKLLGEYARLVLLADRCGDGGLVSHVRRVRGRG